MTLNESNHNTVFTKNMLFFFYQNHVFTKTICFFLQITMISQKKTCIQQKWFFNRDLFSQFFLLFSCFYPHWSKEFVLLLLLLLLFLSPLSVTAGLLMLNVLLLAWQLTTHLFSLAFQCILWTYPGLRTDQQEVMKIVLILYCFCVLLSWLMASWQDSFFSWVGNDARSELGL